MAQPLGAPKTSSYILALALPRSARCRFWSHLPGGLPAHRMRVFDQRRRNRGHAGFRQSGQRRVITKSKQGRLVSSRLVSCYFLFATRRSAPPRTRAREMRANKVYADAAPYSADLSMPPVFHDSVAEPRGAAGGHIIVRSPPTPELQRSPATLDGAAVDLSIVRPAAAAPPRRLEQVEQHRGSLC